MIALDAGSRIPFICSLVFSIVDRGHQMTHVPLRSIRWHRWGLIVAALISILASVHSGAVEVPERPANHLLDQGLVFPPEVAKRLVDSLAACARDYDVHVYVMTVPTLQVMPSRVREKLDELGAAVTESWTKDQVGAVIVFDNEAGWVTVAASDEAERVFSATAINMVFRDRLVSTRKKHLSPEKLEAAAMILIKGMTDLRIKEIREAQIHRTISIVFGLLLVGGSIVLLLGMKRKKTHPERVSLRANEPDDAV